MELLLCVVSITAIAGIGGTGLGGIIAALFRKDTGKAVSLLLSFAAGVMLSIVCFDLVADSIEAIKIEENHANILIVIGSILLGYLVVNGLNIWIDKKTNHEISHIDESHPKTADSLDELIHSDHLSEHKKMNSSYQLFIGGIVMACAIALHNIPEGMVIGVSFADGADLSLAWRNGLAMAIIIGLHNIPEGMAVSVPLISGGMKRSKAVIVTALSGVPTVIGAAVGYWLGMLGDIYLSISLGFASGAMLYVVFGELIPEAILMWRSKLPAFLTLIGVFVGLMIIYF